MVMLSVCCLQAKTFSDELQDVLGRLTDIDSQLITAQPVGGLPETAKDQLTRFTVSIEFTPSVVCDPH